MNNKLFIGINASIFVIFVVGIIAVNCKYENKNRQNLNDYYYDNIKDKNQECMIYLQSVGNCPIWVFSLFTGIIGTIILVLFMLLIFYIPNLSKAILFWLIVWISFVIISITMYKFLEFWNWHYMCADGCTFSDVYQKNQQNHKV